MSVYELNRAQLDELKSAYVSEMLGDPSYHDLATANSIPDDTIYHHFSGIVFTSDDFWCTAGGGAA